MDVAGHTEVQIKPGRPAGSDEKILTVAARFKETTPDQRLIKGPAAHVVQNATVENADLRDTLIERILFDMTAVDLNFRQLRACSLPSRSENHAVRIVFTPAMRRCHR